MSRESQSYNRLGDRHLKPQATLRCHWAALLLAYHKQLTALQILEPIPPLLLLCASAARLRSVFASWILHAHHRFPPPPPRSREAASKNRIAQMTPAGCSQRTSVLMVSSTARASDAVASTNQVQQALGARPQLGKLCVRATVLHLHPGRGAEVGVAAAVWSVAKREYAGYSRSLCTVVGLETTLAHAELLASIGKSTSFVQLRCS